MTPEEQDLERRTRMGASAAGAFRGYLVTPRPDMYSVLRAVSYEQQSATPAAPRRPEIASCELCAAGGGAFVDFEGFQIVMCDLCRKAVT